MVEHVVRRGENGDQQGMSGRGAPGEGIGASTMIQRIPPPKSPPDAKAIFLRWLAAANAGDRIGANDALAELEELAVSPRTKIDDSQAGPDRYAASRVERG
jgi:hypothetical protein